MDTDIQTLEQILNRILQPRPPCSAKHTRAFKARSLPWIDTKRRLRHNRPNGISPQPLAITGGILLASCFIVQPLADRAIAGKNEPGRSRSQNC